MPLSAGEGGRCACDEGTSLFLRSTTTTASVGSREKLWFVKDEDRSEVVTLLGIFQLRDLGVSGFCWISSNQRHQKGAANDKSSQYGLVYGNVNQVSMSGLRTNGRDKAS